MFLPTSPMNSMKLNLILTKQLHWKSEKSFYYSETLCILKEGNIFDYFERRRTRATDSLSLSIYIYRYCFMSICLCKKNLVSLSLEQHKQKCYQLQGSNPPHITPLLLKRVRLLPGFGIFLDQWTGDHWYLGFQDGMLMDDWSLWGCYSLEKRIIIICIT